MAKIYISLSIYITYLSLIVHLSINKASLRSLQHHSSSHLTLGLGLGLGHTRAGVAHVTLEMCRVSHFLIESPWANREKCVTWVMLTYINLLWLTWDLLGRALGSLVITLNKLSCSRKRDLSWECDTFICFVIFNFIWVFPRRQLYI